MFKSSLWVVFLFAGSCWERSGDFIDLAGLALLSLYIRQNKVGTFWKLVTWISKVLNKFNQTHRRGARFASEVRQNANSPLRGDARWVSYERMWNSYRWCVTFYRYQEQINAECANRRGIKNHNQQLFTFFDSCSKTLGRFLAGSCNGLRAHKESSRHFDFLQG